jgi:phage gp36-like protein
VVSHSPEFKEIHQYYTTRDRNPLKKMQSLIAVACKLVRVFYLILKKGVTYDAAKLMGDIRRPAVV